MITRTVLSTLDGEALANATNRVYEGYVIPMHMSTAEAARHVAANDIRLDASPLWIDAAGETVGLGLLGVRESRGWIGGFGIAPASRGQRLARPLAEEMLQRAAALGLSTVQLEVITKNPYAIRTYENVGFKTRRELRVFVRPASADAPGMPEGLEPAHSDRTLQAVLAAHNGNGVPRPSWQREPASMLGREGYEALLLGPARAPRGCVIYQTAATALRVAHLWAADPGDVPRLVDGLRARHPGLGIAVVNEPEDSPLCEVFESLGFAERLRQYEMEVPVAR
jgi:ribosomal protein S18 acetylase RimI-like enzyme